MPATIHHIDLSAENTDHLTGSPGVKANSKSASNPRRSGAWDSAVFSHDGVMVGAWAIDETSLTPPAMFEFRWGERRVSIRDLVARPDVGKAFGCGAPVCGLRLNIKFQFDDIPADANMRLPSLVAIWDDGTELALRLAEQPSRLQFRLLGFQSRDEFERYFQNPAFRISNMAVIAWATRRAIEIFPDDFIGFMSAFCIMIYRYIESGYFSADEILRLRSKWLAMESSLELPIRGERYRWVISIKLALGYFFLIRQDFAEAEKNFNEIAAMDEQISSWPQASTNILIGVFMSAWFNYRRANEPFAIATLMRAYEILKAGVTYLPIWSKHHFSELDNSLRIARECFAFQKFLEGETRDYILPLNSKLSFRMISAVLTGMIDRKQIQDGPFPVRGEYPPATTLRA